MDKTTVTNLLRQYNDCVDLLANEPWPDNLPDLLDDMIHNTKLFTEKFRSLQPKRKPNRKRKRSRKLRVNVRNERKGVYKVKNKSKVVTMKTIKEYRKLNPVVRITPLNVENAIRSKDSSIKLNNVDASKTTPGEKNSQISANGTGTSDSDVNNRQQADPDIVGHEGKYANSLSDGCVIN